MRCVAKLVRAIVAGGYIEVCSERVRLSIHTRQKTGHAHGHPVQSDLIATFNDKLAWPVSMLLVRLSGRWSTLKPRLQAAAHNAAAVPQCATALHHAGMHALPSVCRDAWLSRYDSSWPFQSADRLPWRDTCSLLRRSSASTSAADLPSARDYEICRRRPPCWAGWARRLG